MAAQQFEIIANICVAVLFARFVSYFCYRAKVPRIIGDLLAGCLVGPTFLGVRGSEALFPPRNRPFIRLLGDLGLILSSMVAGANFDRRVLRGQYLSVVSYVCVNSLLPIALTVPLLYIIPDDEAFYGRLGKRDAFFAFLCCITMGSALPFVFLVLDDLKLKNFVARFSIGWACLSMVLLFTLVSVASSLADPSVTSGLIAMRVFTMVGIIVALLVVQRVWARMVKRYGPNSWPGRPTTDQSLLIVCFALGVSIASQRLGYTFILGAFLAGAALPFNEAVRTTFGNMVRWVARWLLLPLFFVNVGVSFNLRTIPAGDAGYLVLVVVWSVLCKLPLVPFARYVLRMDHNQAVFSYTLASIRGFNGLVIANVARDFGAFGDAMYAAAVLLAILTNAGAGPICRRFMPGDGKFGFCLSAREDSSEASKCGVPAEPASSAAAAATAGTAVAVAVAVAAPSPSPSPSPAPEASAREPSMHIDDEAKAEEAAPESAELDADADTPPLPLSPEEREVLAALGHDAKRPREAPLISARPFLREEEAEAAESAPLIIYPDELLKDLRAHVRTVAPPPLESPSPAAAAAAAAAHLSRAAFVGRDAVDWLVRSRRAPSRASASAVLQSLFERGRIAALSPALGEFSDDARVFIVS